MRPAARNPGGSAQPAVGRPDQLAAATAAAGPAQHTLNTLILKGNRLRSCPKGLSCLASSLRRLDLGANQITDVSHIWDFPSGLENLDLSGNCIDSLEEWCRTDIVPDLGSLSEQQQQPMPKGCQHRQHRVLDQLKVLNLRNNPVKVSASAPGGVGQPAPTARPPHRRCCFRALNQLGFVAQSTPDGAAPDDVCRMEHLTSLSLAWTAIHQLPASLSGLHWLSPALSLKAARLDQPQLMVVGNANIGKTTLINRLQKVRRICKVRHLAHRQGIEDPNRDSGKILSTVGVDIGDLVMSAPRSSVIIVGTHLDALDIDDRQLREQSTSGRSCAYVASAIYATLREPSSLGIPIVRHQIHVSCVRGTNLQALADMLFATAKELTLPGSRSSYIVGESIPAIYMDLETVLRELADERKNQSKDPVLQPKTTPSVVQDRMLDKFGKSFANASELMQATAFLHDVGSILHFKRRVVTTPENNKWVRGGLMPVEHLHWVFHGQQRRLPASGDEELHLSACWANLSWLCRKRPAADSLAAAGQPQYAGRRSGQPASRIPLRDDAAVPAHSLERAKLSLVSSSSPPPPPLAVPHQRANGASFAASSQSSSAPVYVPFPPKEPGTEATMFYVKLDDIDSRLGAWPQKLPQSQQQQPPQFQLNPNCVSAPLKLNLGVERLSDFSEALRQRAYWLPWQTGVELYACDVLSYSTAANTIGHAGEQMSLLEIRLPLTDIRLEPSEGLPGTRIGSYHLRCSRQAATGRGAHRLAIGGLVPRLGTRFNQTAEGMFLVTRLCPCQLCLYAQQPHVFVEPINRCSRDLDPDKILSIEQVKILSFIGKGNFGTVFSGSIRTKEGEQYAAVKLLVPYPLTADCSEEDQRLYKEEARRWRWKQCSAAASPTCRPGLSCILLRLHHPNVLNLYGVLAPKPLSLLLELAAQVLCGQLQAGGLPPSSRVLRSLVYQIADALSHPALAVHHLSGFEGENCLVWNLPPPCAVRYRPLTTLLTLASAGIGGGSGDRGGSGGGNEGAASRWRRRPASGRGIITEAFCCGWRWRTTASAGPPCPTAYRGYAGTLAYMAPEILEFHGEETYTEKADIYSFGMLLYELITLKPPFIDEATKSVRQNLGGRPLLYDTDVAGVPVPLLDLLAVCWAQSSRLRPSAAQIRAACQSARFVRVSDACAMRAAPLCIGRAGLDSSALWLASLEPSGRQARLETYELAKVSLREGEAASAAAAWCTPSDLASGLRPMCVEPDHAQTVGWPLHGILAVFDCDNWERPQDSFQQLLAARPAVLVFLASGGVRLYGQRGLSGSRRPFGGGCLNAGVRAAAHCGAFPTGYWGLWLGTAGGRPLGALVRRIAWAVRQLAVLDDFRTVASQPGPRRRILQGELQRQTALIDSDERASWYVAQLWSSKDRRTLAASAWSRAAARVRCHMAGARPS
uniref:Protein kinase domain-containing protein n=1 Tax=Macrostomum lignano TaxID=282301 RepID=A0A1I8FKQ6_9PLAT